MDGHEHSGPLNDDPLAREIEAALAVDPSLEFAARVRSRVAVAADTSASDWRMSMTAFAAVIAVALVAVWWWPRESQPVARAPAAERQERVVATVPDVAPVQQAMSRRPAARDRTSRPVEPRDAIAIDLPEVILAENEASAYATFLGPGREAQLEASLPRAPDLSAPVEVDKIPKIDPVTLDPIDVKPIVHAALERLE